LVDDYFASPEFRDRKPNTQRIYRIILEPIAERMGRHQVRQLERRHVKALRDERADTPGMANMVVKVMRLLLSYAVDNDYRPDNPATRVKTFKLGEHRAWTDTELADFERRWAPGTMERRAYMLARFTGQRRGDLAAMTRAHRKAGSITLKQEKTDTELTIREHRELTAELARGDQSNMSLLVGPDVAAFDPDGLGRWFASAIDSAGLPDDVVLHGLRKVAAKSLADAGCTAHEIMAITGHKSLTEVQRYTEAASQRTGATAAIHKLENAKRTPSGKRRLGPVANGGTDA
jgi:integrase